MKQFARQFQPLSLVPSPKEEPESYVDDNGEDNSSSLGEFFNGWLNSVDPAILQSTNVKEKPFHSFHGLTRLTSTDVIRVNRATIRESRLHRHWPREVVETFLAADVIRRKR